MSGTDSGLTESSIFALTRLAFTRLAFTRLAFTRLAFTLISDLDSLHQSLLETLLGKPDADGEPRAVTGRGELGGGEHPDRKGLAQEGRPLLELAFALLKGAPGSDREGGVGVGGSRSSRQTKTAAPSSVPLPSTTSTISNSRSVNSLYLTRCSERRSNSYLLARLRRMALETRPKQSRRGPRRSRAWRRVVGTPPA